MIERTAEKNHVTPKMNGNTRRAIHTTRRVWAAITADPQAHIRDLACQLDLNPHTIHRILHQLRDAGYIDFADRSERARTVIIPFCITGARP
jgi:predicted ArsR family transcriptional regulator